MLWEKHRNQQYQEIINEKIFIALRHRTALYLPYLCCPGNNRNCGADRSKEAVFSNRSAG